MDKNELPKGWGEDYEDDEYGFDNFNDDEESGFPFKKSEEQLIDSAPDISSNNTEQQSEQVNQEQSGRIQQSDISIKPVQTNQVYQPDFGKKSKAVPILICIIAVLAVAGGILTGILIMKNKNSDNEDIPIIDSSAEESETDITGITETSDENESVQITTNIQTTAVQSAEIVTYTFTETKTDTKPVVSPNSSLKYPILTRGYEDAQCPVMVQKDGEYGTYEEMIASCVNDGITMYSSPRLVNDTIYTATKHDALPDNWTTDLLSYDDFIETVRILASNTIVMPQTTTQPKLVVPPTPVGNMQGELDCRGGVVSGYSTSYVCESGEMATVHNNLSDKMRVTAKNKCYSHGIDWYELWSTDDGDYCGWVDASFIKFYQKSQGDIYRGNAPADMYFYSYATFYATVATENTGLRLRTAPDTNSEIILEMPKGSTVEVLGNSSSWCYVKYTVNQTAYYGYASIEFLE